MVSVVIVEFILEINYKSLTQSHLHCNEEHSYRIAMQFDKSADIHTSVQPKQILSFPIQKLCALSQGGELTGYIKQIENINITCLWVPYDL